MSERRCSYCKQFFPPSHFGKHRGMKDGLSLWCKACSREKGRKFRLTPAGIHNTLKSRIIYREKRKLFFSKEEFITWYEEQKKICVYCGITEKEFIESFQPHYKRKLTRLTIDRKDNDIGYELENIVLACHRCNSIKSDWFTYEEMREIANKYIIPRIEEWKRNPKPRKGGEMNE